MTDAQKALEDLKTAERRIRAAIDILSQDGSTRAANINLEGALFYTDKIRTALQREEKVDVSGFVLRIGFLEKQLDKTQGLVKALEEYAQEPESYGDLAKEALAAFREVG